MYPDWLKVLAVLSLVLAGVSCLWILIDILAGHRQHMWIMDVVWPVTGLYAGPLAVWAYYKVGRLSTHHAMMQAKERGEEPPGKKKPFWQMVGVGALHCGSGCVLADILVESLLIYFPLVLFGQKMFGAWTVDFVIALIFGLAFQYFTIAPMRNLSVGEGIVAAVKADTLSLTAWQVGMYGWMAVATFAIFGQEIAKTSPVFWFMMQLAMLAGFVTSYPINWWLLKTGIKEKM